MATDPRQLLPHQPPMLLLREVIAADEVSAEGTAFFAAGDYMTTDGGVCELALIETLAQLCAAIRLRSGAAGRGIAPGVLAKVTNFRFHSAVPLDRELQLQVRLSARLDPYFQIEAEARDGATLIAGGTLQLRGGDGG
ncbi:hypothetical protein BH09SUM1_BH09SUM1_18680 [soil metagenome]